MEKEMVDILKEDPVYFGRQGENIAREVIFDITSLKKEFPDAVYALVLKRSGDEETYTAVTTTVEGNEFRYLPTLWATANAGPGEWEIHALDSETGLIAKSIKGNFTVDEALAPATDAAPEVADNWLQEVMAARDQTVAAAEQVAESLAFNVEQMQEDILGKIDKPETPGTNGQVLTSDGLGGQSWEDPQETYELPAATAHRMGGVIIGDGLTLDGDGKLTAVQAELATEQRNGLIRAADQAKLNGIEAGANNYTLPTANTERLGGIKVGANLTIDGNGVLNTRAEPLEPATQSRLGGITVGDNLSADANGRLSATIPPATASTIGGIKVGRNLTVDQDGTLHSQDSYVLPTATATRLGGVKIGANLTMNEQGVLSADAQPIEPATEQELGGIIAGNNLGIDENGVLSAYSYDISTTVNNGTNQLNLIRSDGNTEEIVKTVDLPAGGSGGGGGTNLQGYFLDIERVTQSPIYALMDDEVKITVDIRSTETNGGSQSPIDGTYVWKLGTTVIDSGTYSRTRNTFDLTNLVTAAGMQRVSLTVTQSDSNLSQTKSWTVHRVDVRLESNFADGYTYPAGETVDFTFIPYGGVPKTVHFKIDGVELTPMSFSANRSGQTEHCSIPAQSHGTHQLEAWMVATVGIDEISTPSVYRDIIWYDETSDAPVISCAQKIIPVPASETFDENRHYYEKVDGLYRLSDISAAGWDNRGTLYYHDNVVTQYSSEPIVFSVYDPNNAIPTVTLSADGVEVATRTISQTTDRWIYDTDVAGVHTLTITCGVTTADIVVYVEELEGVTIQPVTSGLVFDFNPVGRGNSDANRLWSYTNAGNRMYSMSVSNDFDWRNGGYQLDADGNPGFLIKAGTTATINYRMFERQSGQVKLRGQHFKTVFRVSNVRDASATWLSCMGDANEVGLKMNVHEAYIYTGSSALWSPYSEDDRIEFEYDIATLDTGDNNATSFIMSYEDGTMFRPISYDASNNLQQMNAAYITIGSPDCDVWLYRMKAYENSLTNEDVINNFIADAPNGREMANRYFRNQIYDADQALNPEVLAEACPDLRIIMIDAPHFTNSKDNTVAGTTVRCIYKKGDPALDNWTVENASHSGQGTTSNYYGVAGRNIDVKFTNNNSIVRFGDGSASEPGDVQISLTRDSIPVNYFNIKVNIASSENANNALLAKRYDRYLPYTPPSKHRDPRTKTTMEFHNCVVFIRENDTNLNTHEEFNDTGWHFYGIGNIGDSKKTDNTRVYTLNDVNEFVNEIQDNTLANSRFDTGVYNMLVDILPATGDKYVDYYQQAQDGTYGLKRYLNGHFVPVKAGITEITNGAVAKLSVRPATGVSGIEYYIPSGSGYTMYIWQNGAWSAGAAQTESDFNAALKRHMATAIDPDQWGVGNEKYDAMMADNFSGKSGSTWAFRYEGSKASAQKQTNINVWRQMYTWLVTSSDEDFVAHFEDWFIKDAALYNYLFTEQYTMMDNRAKNTFWHWAKFYITEDEYERADSSYTAVAEDAVYDPDLTYYRKTGTIYVVYSGAWDSRPQLYIHNDCYIVDDGQATTNNGYRFDFWDYDNDSAIGINNTGSLGLAYGKEDIDSVVEGDPTSQNVYNAADSVFFRRIRLLFRSELREMYQRLEDAGCWNVNGFIEEFDNWQGQWPEALWTKDMERKYIRPHFGTSYDNSKLYSADGQTQKKSSTYLNDMLNGRKKYQRRQWIRDQSVYMGTKYLASSVTANQIMLRCYEPSGAVVTPDYTMKIVPYLDMYISILFGSGTVTQSVQVRAKAGQQYTIPCPISMSGATDIPFYIYAGSNIQELSDLSACYFSTNDFGSATRLKKLKIGNSTPGYSNQIQILNLGTGRHDLLEELDLTNCDHLVGTLSNGTLNLAGCGRLKILQAGGTAISSVIFASNSPLEMAVLPNGLTGLTMIGLDKLEPNDLTVNYDNITTLTIEGGNLDTRAIIESVYDTVRTLRMTDVNWTGLYSFNDATILNAISDPNRMAESYLTGTAYISSLVSQRELDHYEDYWNGFLRVDCQGIRPQYVVTYVNADPSHTVLGYEYVNAGETITSPVGRTIFSPDDVSFTFPTPTMEQTDASTFSFIGWDGINDPVRTNRTVMAVYEATPRTYMVHWYGKVNSRPLASGEYAYGSEAIYEYTPTTDTVQHPGKTYYQRTDNFYAVYDGLWDERPLTLYEHNDIPTDTDGESQGIYRLFTGWNKSTGRVYPDPNNADGHVDVYATWATCSELPATTENPASFTPVQIYAITQHSSDANFIKGYFQMDTPDYVRVPLGHDPEFVNVESETLIGTKRWLDGNSGEVLLNQNEQPLRLFSADAPTFTLAIDFEMRNGGEYDNGKTLIACYDINGQGFRLRCGHRESDNSYRPVIEWGNQSFDVSYSVDSSATPGDTRYRDMVVIRHEAGSPILSVYTSNVGSYFNLQGVSRGVKERSAYQATDAPLVIGGVYLHNDNEFQADKFGTGYIHWCKIWYDDLGEQECCKIASWPHETLDMEYYGTRRYNLAGTGSATEVNKSSASFISRKPLYGRALQAASSGTENVLWSNSPVRSFLENRLMPAMPYEWQSMIRTVEIKTAMGTQTTSGIEVTEDRLYIPAWGEVDTTVAEPYGDEKFSNQSYEGSMITWFSSGAARVKSKILDIRPGARIWTGTSDPTSQVGNNVHVGDIWVQAVTGGYPVYVFTDNQTIARERLTIKSDTMATGTGGWVAAGTTWGLRNPSSATLSGGYQYQYLAVNPVGLQVAHAYSNSIGAGDGVAVVPCWSI